MVQAWDLVIPKTCPTRLIISELGNQVQIVDTFDKGFSTADKSLGQLLKVVHGGKNSQMFIQTKTSLRLEILDRWGYIRISMVLWSERSLKSKMLSLARTSKYVNGTSVLSLKTSEDDSLEWKDSPDWTVIVVINLH